MRFFLSSTRFLLKVEYEASLSVNFSKNVRFKMIVLVTKSLDQPRFEVRLNIGHQYHVDKLIHNLI